MLEILRQIPGTEYLLYYSVLSVCCILLARYLIKNDSSTGHQVPDPTDLDSTHIAVLRGGWAALVRSVIFKFYSEEKIKIKGEKKDVQLEAAEKKKVMSDPVENEIINNILKSPKPYDLFNNTLFIMEINKLLEPVYDRLKKLHLLKSEEEMSRSMKIFYFFEIVIVIAGGLKFYLGMIHDKPVIFLIILMIISGIALFLLARPGEKLTRLGKQYINNLQEHFKWFRESFEKNERPEGIDPALPFAVFGLTIVAGIPLYNHFAEAFPMSKEASSWTGGCGGGCAGGCDGGGCDGGGCDGGGCGGCGD